MNKVCIVMTFFNETVDQLNRSISSILNQSFTSFEFIIVPGNPENLVGIEFVKNINDDRIRLIVVHEKTRMTNCLNLAIRNAKSKYIALQEADDESLSERIKVQYNFLQSNPNVDIVGTSITYIDDYSKKILAIRHYSLNPTKDFNRYAAIAHPTVMAKLSIYKKFGAYLETDEFRNCPDYELWLRWISQGVVFRNINMSLFNYYQTNDNGRNKNAKKTLQSVIVLKLKYAVKLNFSIFDKIFLYMEKCVCLLPQKWISKLFYVWIKIKYII